MNAPAGTNTLWWRARDGRAPKLLWHFSATTTQFLRTSIRSLRLTRVRLPTYLPARPQMESICCCVRAMNAFGRKVCHLPKPTRCWRGCARCDTWDMEVIAPGCDGRRTDRMSTPNNCDDLLA